MVILVKKYKWAAMSTYPGENTNLPKNLLAVISHLPLNHLVPKDGLSAAVDSSLTISLSESTPIFNGTKDMDNLLDQEEGICLNTVADEENDKLVFKSPNLLINYKNEARTEKHLLNGLSPLAKKCLELTDCVFEDVNLSSKNIHKNTDRTKRQFPENGKTAEGSLLNIIENGTNKKSKIGSSVAVSSSEYSKQYVTDFINILEYIGAADQTEFRRNDFENWINLEGDSFILSENMISKLHITLKNVMSTPSSCKEIDVENLLKLLEILVENIKVASSNIKSGVDGAILNRISHSSCILIFMIFLLEKEDRRFSKEDYILEPIRFISDSFESGRDSSKDSETMKTQLISLYGSVSLIPSLIEKRPLLDDELISKLVYLFSSMLMSDDIESSVSIQIQPYKDNLKSVSKMVLILLFKKFPDQRELLVEELLSNVEKLPTKRIQKRLRKVQADVFVTDFTITIISLLENLNSFQSCNSITGEESNTVDLFKERYVSDHNSLECFSNQITDTIFQRFIETPSKYRHSLENYVQDLTALLRLPNWSMSQYLLNSMMKKLLLIFNLKNQQSANVETICLQVLGTIGASIFDIRCATLPNQGNNLIQLCNYPDAIPQYFTSFRKCIHFVASCSDRESSREFLWQQRLGTLLKLWEYDEKVEEGEKREDDEDSKVTKLIRKEISYNSGLLLENSSKYGNMDFSDIESDYCSVLHGLQLLKLYEPYLNVVLSLLGSEKIKIRSTAIKCLSMLAGRDKGILSSPMVKETIEKALIDSSASVKDAILDLVSIGSSSIDFYRQINMNYDHESVLVRKHVMKINKTIYDESETRSIKVFVACRILLRTEDEEDTIIDMAKQILLERWISTIVEEQSLEKQAEVCDGVISVMSGVANADEKCAQHFEWFLNFFLLNRNMHSSERYDNVFQCLNKLTDTLVQYIVEVQGTDSKSDGQKKKRTDYLNLLAKFSDTSVSFITKDHIVALYPYLLSDASSDLHYYILLVFKNTFEKTANFKQKFLYDVETTLLSKLPRMNVREIDQAMPLVWKVSKQRGDTSRVTRACSSCFQHLNPYIKQANTNVNISVEGKLQRLLYLATGFARFCNFGIQSEKPQFVNDDESVYAYVAKCLLVLSKVGIPYIIRRITIKNLAQLCCAHPKLFNSKRILELLDEEFESGHIEVKLVLLESLYDFFTLEERKSIRKVGVNSSVSSNKALKAKLLKEKKTETINDGICSALVTRFLKNVLRICLSENIKNSLVAVRLLKLILQHGYTNPSHCIPTMIALVGSTNNYMSYVATGVLNDLFERYETMVFGGISQGIKTALEYSKTLEKSSFYKNDIFLNNLKAIVSKGKKNSSKYSKIILKVLKVNFDRIMNAQCENDTRDFILFLLANLSKFNFTSQGELGFFLKEIDLESEQFHDSIIDKISEATNGDVEDGLINAIIVQKCLQEFRLYVVQLYGVKIDFVSNDMNDCEISSKQLTAHKSPKIPFVPILDQILGDSENKKHFADCYVKER